MPRAKRPDAGSTIEPKTLTNRFADESERWRNSGVLSRYRNSPPYTLQSTITSTRNAISTAAKTSNSIDLPPWRSGSNLRPKMRQCGAELTLQLLLRQSPYEVSQQKRDKFWFKFGANYIAQKRTSLKFLRHYASAMSGVDPKVLRVC